VVYLQIRAETLINPRFLLVSFSRDTMAFKHQFKRPISYRVLPPRWRIVEPEEPSRQSPEQYLQRFDRDANTAYSENAEGYSTSDDLVSFVFGNQLRDHAANSHAQARLIVDRLRLTRQHLADVQWRLDQIAERKPISVPGDGKLSDVEKQIIDLEKQKRQIQLNEWRDLLDLRKAVAEERRAYHNVTARMNYLAGGYDGGA